jgi:hypothetical protein
LLLESDLLDIHQILQVVWSNDHMRDCASPKIYARSASLSLM